MEKGAIKLTKREMIRQVVLKEIPVSWNLHSKRANNHKYTTMMEWQRVLKLIKEADKAKKKFRGTKYRDNIERDNCNHNNDNSNENQQGAKVKSSKKPCTKPSIRFVN